MGSISLPDGTISTGLDVVTYTTVITTNLQVSNIKALDGTAAGSIANSTGVVTLASTVLTTTDINGGTIDGTVIGGSSAAAGTFTALTATGAFTSLGIDDNATANVLTLSGAGSATGLSTFLGDIALSEGKLTITDTANEAIAVFTSGTTGADAVRIIADSLVGASGFTVTSASADANPRALVYFAQQNSNATGTSVLQLSHTGGIALKVSAGHISAPSTITAAATTGAQTINKMSGSVNFAATATSLVVTNSLVTTNSVIICTVATNDATFFSAKAVAASGSFTIHANGAATAETRVNFLVINKGD